MTRADFDTFCAGLPATSHVVQWGGCSVWKVGGKIFAIWSGADADGQVSFKASDLSGAMLRDTPHYRPAPYLARAGWLQLVSTAQTDPEEIRAYVAAAHGLVTAGLPKRLRLALGLA
ncbi:MmcQ/YjbR family DNA-binding protein [Microvirga tunisiensis]|uniref:MmcQ/YjbR family DNA-binding protein n=1 Tax=Pannonibacter tanglangensis TaxID=2750084 RepID=A0A7X5F4D8_9HYPH|nr:MmcQ/YjbR family DNA-binding protein [Pannonibacter sp. XCT-53]NBN79552.1 MmcQ/YjbR family DNA-binding protein [Pannonibacter sp. XCT-53]